MNLNKTATRSILLISLSVLSFTGYSQTGIFKGDNSNLYTAVGIGGGSAHYIGDLTQLSRVYNVAYTNVRWNGTLNYTKYLNPNFGARVSFTWVRLYGDDFTFAKRDFNTMYQNYVRNLHFRNDVQEFAVSGIWNLRKQYDSNTQLRQKFTPYISAGIGIAAHSPKAIAPATSVAGLSVVNNEWVALKPLNTAGQGLPSVDKKPYSSVVPVIPLAIGFRRRVSQNFDVGFEAGYRLALTDYLDDVSTDRYPNFAELEANYGTLSNTFSYRAGEDFHAVTGKSRAEDFQRAYELSGRANAGSVLPSGSAAAIYSPESPDITRGGGNAFYHRFDMYLTTQVTLHYVLSSRVKCPPIK